MDSNKNKIIRIKMQKTAEALQKNNMTAYIADTKEDAVKLICELIPDSATVGVGGSVTLGELDIITLLRQAPYNFLDRYDPSLSKEQAVEVMRKTLLADVFITSTNAVTENGELYNVDGNGNRVAAMIFGPASVVIVAGYNKIVADLDEAERRVKSIAAPANCVRLGIDNPCTVNGSCMNCHKDGRICADTVIMGMQRTKGRIKVILVGQELGY